MGLFDEAKDLASEHSDIAGKAVNEAEQQADNATGGKFDSQISQGGDALEQQLGINGGGQSGGGQGNDGGQNNGGQNGGDQGNGQS